MRRTGASSRATGSAWQAAPAKPCCAPTWTERVQPGVIYTTFHFPESGANVITTENSDWATNCPEYKVTAVQVVKVQQPSDWQRRFHEQHEKQMQLLGRGR